MAPRPVARASPPAWRQDASAREAGTSPAWTLEETALALAELLVADLDARRAPLLVACPDARPALPLVLHTLEPVELEADIEGPVEAAVEAVEESVVVGQEAAETVAVQADWSPLRLHHHPLPIWSVEDRWPDCSMWRLDPAAGSAGESAASILIVLLRS